MINLTLGSWLDDIYLTYKLKEKCENIRRLFCIIIF